MKFYFYYLMYVAVVLVGCQAHKPVQPAQHVDNAESMQAQPVVVERSKLSQFQPLPPVDAYKQTPHNPKRIYLGKLLFFDSRLSESQQIACQSCHSLMTYGVDNVRHSLGHHGQEGRRNAPSVFNAYLASSQFWDGRAATVEAQALMPIYNPMEMHSNPKLLVQTLAAIPGYRSAFAEAFPGDSDPITPAHVAAAIGAFERTLVTRAPWDRYLEGDEYALTNAQKRGLNVFLETGCSSCHTGVLMGASMMQKVGAIHPWPQQADQGLYEQTHVEADKMMFRVASLRNVVKTAPYFHDGSVAELSEAVRKMAYYQLGKQLDAQQTAAVVEFLGALTGELPAGQILFPKLPPNVH